MREDMALLATVLRRPHPARDRTDLARAAARISGLVRSSSTTAATRPTRTAGSLPQRVPPASPGTGG
ncbi:hypothetical protein [Streptomyces nojiriensis]|uniref:hypothetical protein n=1 Tax=Streptomyces nojiriensis TaxID=66374 RepID=UPI00167A9B53|nr:hypothetical protein [Streptomyces nojiriensis]